MCFQPQRGPLCRHLSLQKWPAPFRLIFQKWPENGFYCTLWLGNFLRATTACAFSTSVLPKDVLRSSFACYFPFLIWPNGSAPAAYFRPSQHANGWRDAVFRHFPNILRACIFFVLTLSLSHFYTLRFSAFRLSILSEVWLSKLAHDKYFPNFVYWWKEIFLEKCLCCMFSLFFNQTSFARKDNLFWS